MRSVNTTRMQFRRSYISGGLKSMLDQKRIVETSLSIKGKAYKLWMNFPTTSHPKPWNEFQDLFSKDFLRGNKQAKNWDVWDICHMFGLSLSLKTSPSIGGLH